jgi:hypothetical protein
LCTTGPGGDEEPDEDDVTYYDVWEPETAEELKELEEYIENRRDELVEIYRKMDPLTDEELAELREEYRQEVTELRIVLENKRIINRINYWADKKEKYGETAEKILEGWLEAQTGEDPLSYDPYQYPFHPPSWGLMPESSNSGEQLEPGGGGAGMPYYQTYPID